MAHCSPSVTWCTVQMCLQLLEQRPLFNLSADLVWEEGGRAALLHCARAAGGELIMCQFVVKAERVCTRWT